ncbi:linear amide C-N hydrolase [Sedimentitalea sp. JM2-8]|uniref:Linear amide C-N hydrolase n=1 Tax=Sedimentitalea xiamensis TaxID=3050037 RepID=A0ABT7FKS4_9RHOB|nr:linear amide C-N hydrolase [Sedimentitalea xiamensis]MDK3075743.1 linear amide C-N hydrolase [Sedimentitalea xiamensis]
MKASVIKTRSFKTTVITAVLAAAMTTTALSANTCSRLVTDTEYGTLLIRSADWVSSAPFDAQVSVFPEGRARQMRGEVDGYANAFSNWTTKYHTISFEEHGAFSGLSGQTVNDQGLSAMALSQGGSKPFIEQQRDNGAPAVNIVDVTTFIAENYATTAEVKDALDNGDFQLAWAAPVAGIGHTADLHFSVVDKQGQILLIQLGESGVVNTYLDDSSSDLSVKTNDPLLPEQREYNAQYDLTNAKAASSLPWGITGKDRYARLLAMSEQFDLGGLSYEQVAARQEVAFDVSAVVPFGIQDPATSEDFPTFFTMQFNLDNGDVAFRSMMTASKITFNIEDTKEFKVPMHAKIQKQADNGATEVIWTEMSEAPSAAWEVTTSPGSTWRTTRSEPTSLNHRLA